VLWCLSGYLRRGRRAIGLPQWNNLGSARADAGGLEHRRAVRRQSDLGGQCSGSAALHVTKGRVTADVFMDFLKRLLVNARSSVFVVVDGHPTHRAKSVARFVAAQAGKLALFFLPPYSPELNPDEFVWNDLKNHALGAS
jgi:transposase